MLQKKKSKKNPWAYRPSELFLKVWWKCNYDKLSVAQRRYFFVRLIFVGLLSLLDVTLVGLSNINICKKGKYMLPKQNPVEGYKILNCPRSKG